MEKQGRHICRECGMDMGPNGLDYDTLGTCMKCQLEGKR